MGVTSFHLAMSAALLLLSSSMFGSCSAQLFGGKSEPLLHRACPVEKAKPNFNLEEVSLKHIREFSIQGEGDGNTSAVVNQLWAWLFQK
jgi:hypothetical protein